MNRIAASVRALLERPLAERRIGPFALVEQLGRGGFAPVWLAKETYGATELRAAAVKLFALHDSSDDAPKQRRIIEEARSLCQVEHPNVVRFYSLSIDRPAGVMGLAMEHVAGTPLDARLVRQGRLGIGETLEVGIAIASALSAVHRAGLVHRDVKPANVIEAGGIYKLIDFGIAAADAPASGNPVACLVELADLPEELGGASPSSVSAANVRTGDAAASTVVLGGRWGTVGYVEPGCVAGGLPAAPSSDLYALGAMLFECLTGKLPAAAASADATMLAGDVLDGRRAPPSLDSIDPSLPPPLVKLVGALVAPDRKQRPASAEWVATRLEQIKAEIAGLRRALPPEDVGPFRGLGRFEAGDRDVYFARTSEIAATLQMLRGRGLVALVGASGSGKSSLARAGVLPLVAEGALGGWPRRWDTVVAEPGPDPRASVLAALAPFVESSDATSADDVVAALAERAQSTGWGVVLLLDQLEELSTLATGPSQRWAVDLLSRIAERTEPGVRALVAIRRDMLDGVLALDRLGRGVVRGSVLIEPIGDAAWADVVDQALTAYGYAFEDEATRAMVLDQLRGTSGAMPLVQFALTELWRDRDTRQKRITREGVDRVGGVSGALERHAEATFASFARDRPDAEEVARRVLLSLTTPHGTRVTRPEAELVEAAGPTAGEVIAALSAGRLVVRSADGVTLAHEALLARWGRLERWLAEAREDRLLADELEREAARWRRDPEAVPLWRKRRLAHGEELQRRGAVALSRAGAEFLAASKRSERRVRMIAAASGAVAVFTATIAGGVYLQQNRQALRKEQADREAAEEQMRQIRAKQTQIDGLIAELEDSRTKQQIIVLQQEIRDGTEDMPTPEPLVTQRRPAPPRVPTARPSAEAAASSPPPTIKVQNEW